MTFTIPPFWCGVYVTLGVEFALILTAAIITAVKNKHRRK